MQNGYKFTSEHPPKIILLILCVYLLMLLKNLYISLLFTLIFNLNSFGQLSVRDSFVTINMISFSAGVQAPIADLSKRFGANGSAGLSYFYKTNTNLIFGIEGSFLFGSNVDKSDSPKTDDGHSIG